MEKRRDGDVGGRGRGRNGSYGMVSREEKAESKLFPQPETVLMEINPWCILL